MKSEDDFKQDVWRWFLARAQQHDVYSRYRPVEKKIADHLRDCGIDFGQSDTPDFGLVSEFDGTDNDNTESEAITADDWICNCGKYGARSWEAQKGVTLAIPGPYPLSRMMYEVIKESGA